MTRSASAQMICKLYISGFSNDVCLMISCLLNVMELFRMKNSVEFDFNYGRSGFQLLWLILCNFTVCNSHYCNLHLFFHLDYYDQNTIKSKIYSVVKVYCFLFLPKKNHIKNHNSTKPWHKWLHPCAIFKCSTKKDITCFAQRDRKTK